MLELMGQDHGQRYYFNNNAQFPEYFGHIMAKTTQNSLKSCTRGGILET